LGKTEFTTLLREESSIVPAVPLALCMRATAITSFDRGNSNYNALEVSLRHTAGRAQFLLRRAPRTNPTIPLAAFSTILTRAMAKPISTPRCLARSLWEDRVRLAGDFFMGQESTIGISPS
jgi:hypothetical protein